MRIGWFGGGPEFPCDRLLHLLQFHGDVWAVRPRETNLNLKTMQTMSLDDWSCLKSDEPSMAVVTHPLWVRMIVQHRPTYVIVLLPQVWPSDASSRLCTRLLLAEADMVVTTSERVYLEQCLRRDGVFLWHGDDTTSHGVLATEDDVLFLKDYESIVQSALQDTFLGTDLKNLSERQWKQRLKHYEKLLNVLGGPHETVSFLIASYKYLLQEADAPGYLLQSFEQMIIKGHADCLAGQYRFLSAMQIQAGQVEDAMQTYGITAINPEERTSYYRLLDMYNLGEKHAAIAELYRLNDDLRTARNLLSNPQTDLERTLYVKILVQLERVQEALGLALTRENQCVSQSELHWLTGRTYWRNGQSFAAMHEYLLAAADDSAIVPSIHEWVKMEEAIDGFQRGESDGTAASS